MRFFLYKRNDILHPNRYGINEPKDTPSIDTETLDIILTPLVAFDRQGHRLGMGGGYYDRTFSFLLNQADIPRPKLIGLAYACQEVPSLSPDPWDVPLHGVVTERKIVIF